MIVVEITRGLAAITLDEEHTFIDIILNRELKTIDYIDYPDSGTDYDRLRLRLVRRRKT